MVEGRDGPVPGDRPVDGRADALGDGAPDVSSTGKPLWGTTPGQTISRVLLVIGLLLMLWVVYVVITAMG